MRTCVGVALNTTVILSTQGCTVQCMLNQVSGPKQAHSSVTELTDLQQLRCLQPCRQALRSFIQCSQQQLIPDIEWMTCWPRLHHTQSSPSNTASTSPRAAASLSPHRCTPPAKINISTHHFAQHTVEQQGPLFCLQPCRQAPWPLIQCSQQQLIPDTERVACRPRLYHTQCCPPFKHCLNIPTSSSITQQRPTPHGETLGY